MNRFDLENLESRTLCAVTMSINRNGSLVIEGTAGNDAVTIMSTATGITVQSASLDAIKGNTKLWDSAYYSLKTADLSSVGGKAVQYRWGPVKRVLVIGNGGSDAIAVDTTTQNVTQDMGIDSRVILLKHNRHITDYASTALPGTYGTAAVWMKQWQAQIASVQGKNPGMVFLGDSITARFPTRGAAAWTAHFRSAMNLGMVGDTTSQMLYRVEHGLLDHMKPKLLVLEVGTNNISLSDNPQSLYRGVQSLMAAIRSRLPETRVLISGILPRADVYGDAGAVAANALLKKLDNGNTVRFLDIYPSFSSAAARQHYFFSDGIHIDSAGYRLWADLMTPLMDVMLHGSSKR